MAEQRKRRAGSLTVLALILGLLIATGLALSSGGGSAPDRVHELSLRLRCPVCKSVSIAESPSESATAMRESISEQVAAGRTDPEIIDYFRARYGSWVLLDPPTRGATLLLWLLPVGVAGLGLAVLVTRVRRGHHPPARELDEPDRARLETAMAQVRSAGRSGQDEP